ncbi:glycosyltransferase family 4 protein [Marinoscillum sp.]|uniref:glycosyltransferase family 4 protein n=1 Tax=Marinoscillum sp. TaxID=2024838 RepID=UPI003BAC20B4
MNLLFTTHQGELAGSTLSIYYLAKGLAGKGHQVHVACRQGCLLWQKLQGRKNLSLHHLDIRSYLDLRVCTELMRIVRDHGIQLINAQGGKDRNLSILAKWLFRLNVKLVFTRRQRPRDEPWIKRWFHTAGTDRMVMISHGLKKIFEEKGYTASHLLVIHNGVSKEIARKVDPVKVEELRNRLNLHGKKVIGCVSRKKSQEQLLEALALLPADYVGLMVGIRKDEIDRKYLVGLHDRVHFIGMVNHDEALHYLKLMAINVLPSYLDGFGLALVESMLLEVPVIGSDFGGISDVIRHGNNGYLFQNGNINQLKEQIEELTTNLELRNVFIQNGRQIALQEFSVDRMVEAYEHFFKNLLQ